MNRRVFIFENVKHDLSAAKQFGQVVVLFPEGTQRRSLFDEMLIEDIKNRLAEYNFNHKEDYIAATGQLNQVVLLAVAMTEENKEFSLLLFDARDRIYQEMKVNPTDEHIGEINGTINKRPLPSPRQSS